jgi:hypothetical protein
MKNKKKTETVDEFLARGGKITIIPRTSGEKSQTVHSTIGGPAVILSLDDASLLYGQEDKKVKNKKPLAGPTIDVSALPAHLKKKFVDKLLEEVDDE